MIYIPLGGNVFPTPKSYSVGVLQNIGIVNWSNQEIAFTAYVYLDQSGSLEVVAEAVSSLGEMVLEVNILGVTHNVAINIPGSNLYPIGSWEIKTKGYIPIKMTVVGEIGSSIPLISNLGLSGSSVNEHTVFVPNGVDFTFGRRGTSIYLGYPFTNNKEIEWMYCEVIVPVNNDPHGCYNCAIRWAHGYFGIQVLSDNERWVLFSVWGPDKNNNPNMVADELKVKETKAGTSVVIRPFGNEGNGLQSIFRYHWKPGVKYRFLVRGVPSGPNHTVFSAYFFVPEENDWKLISCLKCPTESSYLRDFSSFIENFKPDYGDVVRECIYQNQWIRTSDGQWIELADAILDPTQEHQYRLDYDGGIKEEGFYLKTAGFFKGNTLPKTALSRMNSNRHPEIDFGKLESCSVL